MLPRLGPEHTLTLSLEASTAVSEPSALGQRAWHERYVLYLERVRAFASGAACADIVDEDGAIAVEQQPTARLGAFEVTAILRSPRHESRRLISSKLASKQWPSRSGLDRRLRRALDEMIEEEEASREKLTPQPPTSQPPLTPQPPPTPQP